MTMYSEIVVPSEGDGSTFTLVGHGYYRGNRLAAIHFRVGALLIDLALFYALYLPLSWLNYLYSSAIAPRLPYELWAIQAALGLLAVAVPVVVTFLNIIVMQSRTGQSFGKMCLGLVLVCPRVDPMNVGFDFLALPGWFLLMCRTALHAIDAFLLVGVAFVAFTTRRESIADKACNTLVLRPVNLDAVTLHKGLLGARDR